MATLHHNISGELAQELIAPGDDITVSRISFANIQKISNCKLDLYIEKKLSGRFYLLRNVDLQQGATLIYDNAVRFSTATDEFGLYIKLTDGEPFTITGSIDPAASTTVTGSGTTFLSEISVGDDIVVSSETKTVSAIASDTSLTVSDAFSDNANDTTPDCYPTALVDVIIQ